MTLGTKDNMHRAFRECESSRQRSDGGRESPGLVMKTGVFGPILADPLVMDTSDSRKKVSPPIP